MFMILTNSCLLKLNLSKIQELLNENRYYTFIISEHVQDSGQRLRNEAEYLIVDVTNFFFM